MELYKDLTSNINSNTAQLIIKQGEDLLNKPYPVILASHYSNFSATGNRTDFEDIYFKRRHMLNAFILAELVENKQRFLSRIIDGIFLLCEESGWQLPPHNSYDDGLGNQPYSDITRPVLDLFSCETGALLSFTGFLLKDRLDNVSPIIYTRIEHEVINRILIPYHNTHTWWMGDGVSKTCNWTPWCTQNVLISAIFTHISPDMRTIIFSKASKSLNYFMNDYGFDGCCDEGALYYRHAGLCFWLSLELLKSQDFDISEFISNHEKIKNIAEYILNVHVKGDYYINFADCAPNPGPCSVREYLFGKFVGSHEIMAFAADDFVRKNGVLMSDEINLFYRYLALCHENEINEFHSSNPYNSKNGDVWYESTGLAIARSHSFCLAVKAGNNNDSHNHNDTGSITLYVHGKPCFIDLGVESYTAKTFSSERYSIWTMQSSFHNLPEVNGYEQLPGPEYKATDVYTSLKSPDNDNGINSHDFTMSMDIAGAYDIHAGISSLKRSVKLIRQTDEYIDLEDIFISVNDESTSVAPVYTENFMTYERPYWSENVLHIGSLAEFHIADYEQCNIEEIEITDKRLSKAYKNQVYRIRLTVKDGRFKGRIIPKR